MDNGLEIVGWLDGSQRVWCGECAQLLPHQRQIVPLKEPNERSLGSDAHEVCEGCHKEFHSGGRFIPGEDHQLVADLMRQKRVPRV